VNFLVTVQYDPGTPKTYTVEGVPDARAARTHVREHVLGYSPGVPVEVRELNTAKVHRFSNLGYMETK
jgi:hypothetical protein